MMKKRSEMKIQKAIARAKRTVLGRTLCRIAGDRAGGVMMEYVILGVLVAAAVVAVVAIFGQRIGHSFGVMTKAVSGDMTGAQDDAKNARDGSAAVDTERDRNKDFHK
jgi:Flp pilus assembly pilin Flp